MEKEYGLMEALIDWTLEAWNDPMAPSHLLGGFLITSPVPEGVDPWSLWDDIGGES